MDSPIEVRLFRAHGTLLEMLKDRGYDIAAEQGFETVENIKEKLEGTGTKNPEGNE